MCVKRNGKVIERCECWAGGNERGYDQGYQVGFREGSIATQDAIETEERAAISRLLAADSPHTFRDAWMALADMVGDPHHRDAGRALAMMGGGPR